ncbi:unnamed protein product [Mytilus coruscus]|nr:unnamed protein product [Mytilus coruscus]
MVKKTILSFKNGKSPDELKISAEHLKYGGSSLMTALAFIINFLFSQKGELSHQIVEQQGVRQGGIWSPSAYKLFINSLLTTFEENQIGATIGSIYCGIPTVADDVTLITTDPYELQTMLDIQSRYANKNRYEISEQKSVVLAINDTSECTWHLNGKTMTTPTSSTHLGIERDNMSNSGTKLVAKKQNYNCGKNRLCTDGSRPT